MTTQHLLDVKTEIDREGNNWGSREVPPNPA